MAAEETAGRVQTVLEMRQIKDFSPSLATAGKQPNNPTWWAEVNVNRRLLHLHLCMWCDCLRHGTTSHSPLKLKGTTIMSTVLNK